MEERADILIIGGGIVGLATAMTLARRTGAMVVVAEAENEIARHQTGHNSGVIHSGLYYKPGSLKAVNCTRGREELVAFCREHNVAHEICGKVVVAVDEDEVARLEALRQRGEANGLTGMTTLSAEALKEREPSIQARAALLVPQTGIVDFKQVADAYRRVFTGWGGVLRTGFRVASIQTGRDEIVAHADSGDVIRATYLINCGGLYSDRIASMAGVDPGLQIVPFRGEYYELRPERSSLIRHLVYPVPDPRFPFLGVHFTRMIHGGVEAGPNAVLALAREGYRWRDISVRDLLRMASYGGFRRMTGRYWRTGFGEMRRSLNKPAFVNALRRLMPELQDNDLMPGGSGVRAQAVLPDGSLADDFRIAEAPRMIHVLNAPSPAATASLSIGRDITSRAIQLFGLREIS